VCLSLRFKKQIRCIENALADRRRCLAPSGIELACFPRVAVILREDGGHPPASFQADAHRRHQKLHSHLRRDFSFTYLLLNRFGQCLNQRQSP
jgi:hypothetical protein